MEVRLGGDLISREAALLAVSEAPNLATAIIRLRQLAKIKPLVVANITGGVLQGASSDYRVDVYALDFDLDTFDDDTTCILVDGDMAELGQAGCEVDPEFVRQVIEAPERFTHNQALVCGQCEGTGFTQSASNLEEEVCPVCDGSGEKPDA
jgi:hypothetical protein